ncbi:hypothetical protein LTR99_001226 [Exophiala xenobiotica]|uniref:Uncharacterized protein n=1 Tax=Vermiconidia calcicola TaxID=1690605 RepID=A0AAV9QP62_9PEZI|nr:hypothetical protein LTR92_001659 [Exophiala xenobiotica]KAK5545787.1 hypothetical protein LTR25_000797 [Vermiconidia calcicola]KAK5549952.1 hypothetical protein LTR23_000243 [Chaetothyriales sp. CCFEE 6169]KAK5271619.1 hypothetical protein LTR96_003444 [Exophiala xenobiotica]KAK5308251.1 hypothetical protein LTR99_001226 [Exophiala xenobiotica]
MFNTVAPSTINGAITHPYGRPTAAVAVSSSSSSTAGVTQSKPQQQQQQQQQTECPRQPHPPLSEAREIGQFFVHSTEHPRGHRFFTPKPEEISFLPPPMIKRPDLAETRQLSLQRVPPCILFVQFPCKQRCRSLGICIHYQFVLPCGKCPDGLICPACMRSNTQQAISASRKCPFHQNPYQANPINSRVEDFLATDSQKAVCDEILSRSLACRWEDTTPAPPGPGPGPGPAQTATSQCHEGEGDESSTADGDHRFARESTPRNLGDVQMMDNVIEQAKESESESESVSQEDGGIHMFAPPSTRTALLVAEPHAQRSSTSTGLVPAAPFDLFGGPLGMQVSMPPRRLDGR